MTIRKTLGLVGLITASTALAADITKEAPSLVGWPIAYPQFRISGPSLYYATRERFGQYTFISGSPDVDTLADPKGIFVICDHSGYIPLEAVIESSNKRYTLNQRKDPENFNRFPEDDFPRICYTIEKKYLADSQTIWFIDGYFATGFILTFSQGAINFSDNDYDSQTTFV